MAVKYKEDQNNEFKSVDRDIREHELAKDNFDSFFTDSTCPFHPIIDEVKQPGEEFNFALNVPDRVNRFLTKGWYVVSPERLKTKREFFRKDLRAETDCITTGDTVLLARDERYGIKEQEYYQNKAEKVMLDTLHGVKTDIHNPIMPFSDKGYYESKHRKVS